jgi:hypothetical protein
MGRSSAQSAPSGGRPKAVAERPLYERDYYTWSLEQARLIREGRMAEIDLENVAEEMESLGKSQYSALRSSLARVIQHLLKWDYQPAKRTRSWVNSIEIHRIRAQQNLEENPGLRSKLDEIIPGAYRLGVAYAIKDMNLPRTAFPEACPYDFDAIMTREISLTSVEER